MRVRVGVSVGALVGISVCVGMLVADGEIVAVGMYSEMDCTVRAATVLMFEMAESTRSCGSTSIGVFATLGLAMAAADTIQNRLNPTSPAESTVRGARYSLSFKRCFSYY